MPSKVNDAQSNQFFLYFTGFTSSSTEAVEVDSSRVGDLGVSKQEDYSKQFNREKYYIENIAHQKYNV